MLNLSDDLQFILDTAVWAASGDNGQPWEITVYSDVHFTVRLKRDDVNVFNIIPLPDLMSLGMLIENADLAAKARGKHLRAEMKDELSADIFLEEHTPDQAVNVVDLLPYIKTRSVNRFAFKRKALSAEHKKMLEACLDEDMTIAWYENNAERFRIARMMMASTNLRLRMPESYQIHKDIIDWNEGDSAEGLPVQALGISALSAKALKWMLDKESRNQMMARIPGATLPTSLELDFIPAMFCGAHFVVAFDPEKCPEPTAADFLRAGRAMQRFWLTLTKQHICMQPWYIALVFSLYVDQGIEFTTLRKQAEKLHAKLTGGVLNPHNISLPHVFFTGRVGAPSKIPAARSVRRPLEHFVASAQV